MATILKFRRTADPAPRTSEVEDRPLGQIIIFPGVRIERHAHEGTPRGTANSSRKGAQRRKKQR